MLNFLLDWSEVWALTIPLFFCSRQPATYKPVVFYICMGLLINLCIDLIWKCRTILPHSLNSNNYLYNLHSIIRFFAFSLFFIRLNQPFLVLLKKIILIAFTIFLLLNFAFYEEFFNYVQFSSRLLSVEAFSLLFYSLQYYLFKIMEDIELEIFTADFWIVTGLGIYVAINFFIFLLYNELTIRLQRFAIDLWNVHNISFVIFCLFLARGLHESRRH